MARIFEQPRKRWPYRQRAQVETVFSQVKRRLDSSVNADSYWSQCRALMLKALVHNIMLLRRRQVFNRANEPLFFASPERPYWLTRRDRVTDGHLASECVSRSANPSMVSTDDQNLRPTVLRMHPQPTDSSCQSGSLLKKRAGVLAFGLALRSPHRSVYESGEVVSVPILTGQNAGQRECLSSGS